MGFPKSTFCGTARLQLILSYVDILGDIVNYCGVDRFRHCHTLRRRAQRSRLNILKMALRVLAIEITTESLRNDLTREIITSVHALVEQKENNYCVAARCML